MPPGRVVSTSAHPPSGSGLSSNRAGATVFLRACCESTVAEQVLFVGVRNIARPNYRMVRPPTGADRLGSADRRHTHRPMTSRQEVRQAGLLSVAEMEQLKDELRLCERHVALLRELLGLQSGAPPARSVRLAVARPNAGMRRFILETVHQRPGVGLDMLTTLMSRMGFRGTVTRTLKRVVVHELRALARRGALRFERGRIYARETAG